MEIIRAMLASSVIETPQFPAMEALIGRLPINDLLAMSGFIQVCLEKHAHSAVAATQRLTCAQDVSPTDRELINTLEDSLNHILRGSGSLLATIGVRFEQLNEAEADQQLREKLQQLFPDMPIEGR